jgi:hypothetical protein
MPVRRELGRARRELPGGDGRGVGSPSHRSGDRGRRVRGSAHSARDDPQRHRAARFARCRGRLWGRAAAGDGGRRDGSEAGDNCLRRDPECRRCSLGRPISPGSRERPDRPTCADTPGGAIRITARRRQQGAGNPGASSADRCLTSDGPGISGGPPPAGRGVALAHWRTRLPVLHERCCLCRAGGAHYFEAIAQSGERPPVEWKGAGSSPAGLVNRGRASGIGHRPRSRAAAPPRRRAAAPLHLRARTAVAQWMRAPGYEPGGRAFESRQRFRTAVSHRTAARP